MSSLIPEADCPPGKQRKTPMFTVRVFYFVSVMSYLYGLQRSPDVTLASDGFEFETPLPISKLHGVIVISQLIEV